MNRSVLHRLVVLPLDQSLGKEAESLRASSSRVTLQGLAEGIEIGRRPLGVSSKDFSEVSNAANPRGRIRTVNQGAFRT
jgi:hypothetical protein